jgi:hypothetical protein
LGSRPVFPVFLSPHAHLLLQLYPYGGSCITVVQIGRVCFCVLRFVLCVLCTAVATTLLGLGPWWIGRAQRLAASAYMRLPKWPLAHVALEAVRKAKSALGNILPCGRERPDPCCVFGSKVFFVRQPEVPCAGVLCWLALENSLLCRVVFKYDCRKNRWK